MQIILFCMLIISICKLITSRQRGAFCCFHLRNSSRRLYPCNSLYGVIFLLLPGSELPLVESFGLLNDLFPFPSILGAGYPVFDLHLADVLFDVILPSVLGSSLLSFG